MTGNDADVVVIGGGIAGLAAAFRLKTHGLTPLVIEQEARVGGRMRTDRMGGFSIDRGVTILGRRFQGMLALVQELGLKTRARRVAFSLAIDEADGTRVYRARRQDDLLLGKNLSWPEKLAILRFGIAMWRNRRLLRHGLADQAAHLDDSTAQDYVTRLGAGGRSLLNRVFEPGLRAAAGGELSSSSRYVLLSVVFNTLDAGLWNFDGGVDVLPEALAARVKVRTATEATAVRRTPDGVAVEVRSPGGQEAVHARGVVLAIPGHTVAHLASSLPGWIVEPLGRTSFTRIASVHLGLRRPPDAVVVGIGFAAGHDGIGVLELEHLRAPGRCPPGKGMVSVYFVDAAGFDCVDATDEELTRRALAVVAERFPGAARDVELRHIVRWPIGIARFPPGRIRELATLRQRLETWDEPIDFAGDWLDGVASESALQTGEQAADRMARRLTRASLLPVGRL